MFRFSLSSRSLGARCAFAIAAIAVVVASQGCAGDTADRADPVDQADHADSTGENAERTSAGTAGQLGIPLELKTQPPLQEPYVTPAGRTLVPGARDSLGYRLPLDVFYPKDPATEPARSRDASEAESSTQTRRPEVTDLPRLEGNGQGRSGLARSGSPFQERRISPDDGHTQNETTIGVDGSTVIAGWNGYTDSGLFMGVARSTDGGDIWTTDLLAGHSVMSDPAIRAAGAGRWYYAYLASGGFGGSDIDIFVRRSTDDGVTWETPVDASQNGSFDDKPYIDAAGDEVLVGWADFGFSPARIRASRSLDGGVSYGSVSLLSSNSTGNGACPVIAPDGDYFVFWRGSAQESLWVAHSTDDGLSWTPDRGIVDMNPLPSTFPGGFRIINIPTADADPLTGDLVVLWNDQRFGNPDILSIRSTDDGSTWSAPVRVNDDVGTGAQWFPWLHFDENGLAHATWYDRRNDASLIDVYYARSLDGGVTWEENVRVTAAGFTPVLPWDTSVQFIGDYNGIASNGLVAYPCYQDSREGNQDVYVSAIPLSVTDVPGQPGISEGPDFPGSWSGRLTAVPNPFTTSIRVQVRPFPIGPRGRRPAASGPALEEFTLIISDVKGRTLLRTPLRDSAFEWDGRDATGRLVASGTYFVSIAGYPQSARRIVRVE